MTFHTPLKSASVLWTGIVVLCLSVSTRRVASSDTLYLRVSVGKRTLTPISVPRPDFVSPRKGTRLHIETHPCVSTSVGHDPTGEGPETLPLRLGSPYYDSFLRPVGPSDKISFLVSGTNVRSCRAPLFPLERRVSPFRSFWESLSRGLR